MDITEVSILHHMAIVLLGLWFLSSFNWCHPVAYFAALIYLYLVHESYFTRLRKKLQYEERKQANQRRVLSDSETVRWLNHAVENIWPICMEQIASQNILLPIIPWFLEKYKPWTAKEAVIQHLYLGRNPPLFTEVRVLRQCNDDHLVLELGMNFLTADDMNAILAVKLRKRLGFGIWAKLHITSMHVEGKILVGVKFLRTWPFLGRLRVCFVAPPYFQMTVKPLFNHGLDMTELPGIAGWLDKLLSIAFEQTLVEPNMLVVDVEKFVSPQAEPWFSVNVKEPVAYAQVEVIEASDMKPSDFNGLADPYVKGHLGGYRFKTKIQRKTLGPKWHEEFKIPILTWDSPNVLVIEVCDKDHFYDDNLGDCNVNIIDLRDGQRHDMWLPLQNIKTGRLHLAITILEKYEKSALGDDNPFDQETEDIEERRNSFANEAEAASEGSFSFVSSRKSSKLSDNFEPIDIEGQKDTGIWVHHPGSEVSQTWESRKGKSQRHDTEIHGKPNDAVGSSNSTVSGSVNNDSSSLDDNSEHKHRMKSFKRGLKKIGSVFHRNQKHEEQSGGFAEAVQSPYANIRAVHDKDISVKFVMDDTVSGFPTGKVEKENTSTEESGPESPGKQHVKDMAKNILKHGVESARSIKHVLSFGSRKYKGDPLAAAERKSLADSDSSDDMSLSASAESPRDVRDAVVSQPMGYCRNDSIKSGNVVWTGSTNKESYKDPEKVCLSDRSSEEFVEAVELKGNKEEMVGEKRDVKDNECRIKEEGVEDPEKVLLSSRSSEEFVEAVEIKHDKEEMRGEKREHGQ